MKKKHLFNLKCVLTLFFILTLALCDMYAQNSVIEGHIKDVNKESLIGVTVRIKGSSIGTVTNIDGKYILSNVPPSSTLEVSFVGMRTQEILVNNRTRIDVVLQEDISSLDEIVVVGYGSQKKVNLTGAVAVVSGKDIASKSSTDVVNALMGQIPGLLVENLVLKQVVYAYAVLHP